MKKLKNMTYDSYSGYSEYFPVLRTTKITANIPCAEFSEHIPDIWNVFFGLGRMPVK